MKSGKIPTLQLLLTQLFWVVLGHLPPLFIWGLTKTFDKGWAVFEKGTPEKVASIVTGFTFTMMGFLVAALMVLSLFSDSRTVRRYRNGPYVKMLIIHIGLTLAELAVVFAWAMSLILTPPSVAQVKWVTLAGMGCLGMTLLCCFPILVVQYKAAHEHSQTPVKL